jgi:hypothetical protein
VPRLFGRLAALVHRTEGLGALGRGALGGLLQSGKLGSELRKPVRPDEPLGRRRAGTPRNEPVPPAHHSLEGDEPLSRRENLPEVRFGDRDLAEPPHQFGGRLDMVGKPPGPWRERRIALFWITSRPATRTISFADRGIGIFTKSGCKRPLVACLRREAADRRAAAMFERSCKRVMLGPGRGKRSSGGCELGLGTIATLRCSGASFLRFEASGFGFARRPHGGLSLFLGRSSRFDLIGSIADVRELLGEPRSLLLGPGKLHPRSFKSSIGNPPLGTHCRLACKQLGKRRFRLARERL